MRVEEVHHGEVGTRSIPFVQPLQEGLRYVSGRTDLGIVLERRGTGESGVEPVEPLRHAETSAQAEAGHEGRGFETRLPEALGQAGPGRIGFASVTVRTVVLGMQGGEEGVERGQGGRDHGVVP